MNYEYNDYIIKPARRSPNLVEVVTAGRGGKIPDCLSGCFTSTALAKAEIDKYLASKKGSSNGKAVAEG